MKVKNTKKMRIFNFVIVAMLMLGGCTEKIDLDLNSQGYSRLVVEGMITDQRGPHTVKLTKTVDYETPTAPEPVTDAEVAIFCENNVFPLTETAPGIYQTADTVCGIPGKTYILKIKHDNKEYHAECYMHDPMPLDSIEAVEFPYGDPPTLPHYQINLYAQDSPKEKEFFLFKYSLNNVVWDTVRYWQLYTDEFYNGKYLTGEMIQIIQLYYDAEVRLISYSIPEKYFIFAQNIFMTSQPEMFFMGPPANVKGNISNGGLGYFLATAVRTSPPVFLKYAPKEPN